MAKNKISDLRDHLFETLEGLKDLDKPMDLDRAHAVCEVAAKIIDSAKVEVELVKAINARAVDQVAPGSRFFDVVPEDSRPRLAAGGAK